MDESGSEGEGAQLRPFSTLGRPRSTWPSLRAVAFMAAATSAAVVVLGVLWHASAKQPGGVKTTEGGRPDPLDLVSQNFAGPQIASTCRPFPGKRIILVTANEAFVPMFCNWLKSVTPHLNPRSDHVVVIAHDLQATITLKRLAKYRVDFPNFTVLQPADLVRDRKLQSVEANTQDVIAGFDFLSDGYANIVNMRPNLLGYFLQQGCTVLYNDVDMVWTKSFFKEMRMYGTGHDLYIANDDCNDVYNRTVHDLCTGFMYVEPRPQMIRLMQAWSIQIADKPRNQPGFNAALWGMMATEIVRWYKLPLSEHPPGCRAEEHPNATVIHANWVKPPDMEHKIAFFKQLGLWRL